MPASAAHGKRTVGIATEQRRVRTEGVTAALFRWCIEFDGSSETSKERRISEIRRETRENAQMSRSEKQGGSVNKKLKFLNNYTGFRRILVRVSYFIGVQSQTPRFPIEISYFRDY